MTGPLDLVAAFARPLPFRVIADVLGVPADRQGWLGGAMDTFGRALAGQRDHANVERGNAAVAEMLDYFDDLLEERAGRPQGDVMSLLAADPANGGRRDDLLANCTFFVLAGHATTTASSPPASSCSASTATSSITSAITPSSGRRPSRSFCGTSHRRR